MPFDAGKGKKKTERENKVNVIEGDRSWNLLRNKLITIINVKHQLKIN